MSAGINIVLETVSVRAVDKTDVSLPVLAVLAAHDGLGLDSWGVVKLADAVETVSYTHLRAHET